MDDVLICLENDVEGLVAVGSFLSDAVKSLGLRFELSCDHAKAEHSCSLIISKGGEILSPITKTETEHFKLHGRRPNERLACEARIIKTGELSIMTHEKKEESKKSTEIPKDKFQQEFDELPLEQKITRLLRMEAVTLSETVSYVVNSPMKVVEKVGDVMAEFGMRLEAEAKKATRPADVPISDDPTSSGPAEPKSSRKKPDTASDSNI